MTSTAESAKPGAGQHLRQRQIFLSRNELTRYVRWQRRVDWILMVPFYSAFALGMRWLGKYTVPDRERLRAEFRQIVQDHPRLLICANHLTFIDSAILVWALGSPGWYLRNFSKFSWNLPAGDFFKKKLIFRVVAFLAKCIFIHRDGSREHKTTVLEVCRDLVAKGEVVTVFPEGKRSRSGRFDLALLTHGVGRIVNDLDGDCSVLCAYVRSHLQDKFSDYPPIGSRFYIEMEVIRPGSARAPADITHRIGATIKRMEDAYFARRGACTTP